MWHNPNSIHTVQGRSWRWVLPLIGLPPGGQPLGNGASLDHASGHAEVASNLMIQKLPDVAGACTWLRLGVAILASLRAADSTVARRSRGDAPQPM